MIEEEYPDTDVLEQIPILCHLKISLKLLKPFATAGTNDCLLLVFIFEI